MWQAFLVSWLPTGKKPSLNPTRIRSSSKDTETGSKVGSFQEAFFLRWCPCKSGKSHWKQNRVRENYGHKRREINSFTSNLIELSCQMQPTRATHLLKSFLLIINTQSSRSVTRNPCCSWFCCVRLKSLLEGSQLHIIISGIEKRKNDVPLEIPWVMKSP